MVNNTLLLDKRSSYMQTRGELLFFSILIKMVQRALCSSFLWENDNI